VAPLQIIFIRSFSAARAPWPRVVHWSAPPACHAIRHGGPEECDQDVGVLVGGVKVTWTVFDGRWSPALSVMSTS